MLGTIFNILGILAGGAAGLLLKKQPSAAAQNQLKLLLGSTALVFGLRLVWLGLNGTFRQGLKQFAIVLAALILGRLLGKLLQLQKVSNRLGQYARQEISNATSQQGRWSSGFQAATALFCAAPLGILGAVADGLGNHWQPLLVKGIIEGMAVLGFVSLFGGSVVLAAVPVFALQGTITLVCSEYIRPILEQYSLLESVILTDGWLITFVALVILEIRKIELADYLPALAIAPLLTWLWH